MHPTRSTRPRHVVGAAAWLTAAVLLAACTGDEADSADPVDETAVEETDGDTAPDDASDDDSRDGPGASGRLELSGWDEDHATRASIALEAIEVDDAGDVFLDIDAINERDGSIHLEWRCCETFLEDDLGNRYPLVGPEDNRTARLASGERLDGTLAFAGPVATEASQVTLAVNARDDEITAAVDDDQRSVGPSFAFHDVPLPGVGRDDEADRAGSRQLTDEAAVELDETQTIYDDTDVTVVEVRSDGRRVAIDLEVDNHDTDRPARLVASSPDLETLEEPGDFEYVPIQSEDERRVEVPEGGSATVTMTFRGAVPADAEEFVLTFNPPRGDTGSGPWTGEVSLDPLPLPDGAAGGGPDGSDPDGSDPDASDD